ncbi:acyl-CoA thioesterase [Francisella frigiditurris]|uniref:Acyl-ACP thioesterase family protein n=1 Tax=Francisella frigiditurris TaxID=1542390 RepID=A0A1J0KSU8_9GAMM|nr:thioesterase family protein [Francisella frigiditurris]APC96759.1 acyl-ACP thioesterase family protein [Francisella frigiditurris]
MTNKNSFKLITNIRWSDTDKYGHVNNGKYFDYFEEARTTWVYQTPALIQWAKKNTIQLVISEQCCNYKIPLTHPNKLEVSQTVIKCGAASIELNYEIKIFGSNEIATAARVKLACYNATTGRLHKLPKEIKDYLLENDK